MPTWIHLEDPEAEELERYLPPNPHEIAERRLRQTRQFQDPIFARLESHDGYLFGELAYPIYHEEEDEVETVGIRVLIEFQRMLTIVRTPHGLPEGIELPDLSEPISMSERPALNTGDCIFLLIELLAREIHELLDDVHQRVDDLEELMETIRKPPADCRQEIAALRNIFLQFDSVISPTLSVVEKIVDDKLDLRRTRDDGTIEELVPRGTEIRLLDVQEGLRHASQRTNYGSEMLDALSDSLSEYLSREQTKAGNRLAALASIMLLPTFIVGLYGMNIDSNYFPEFGWLNGYLLAWLAIIVITLVQVFAFRKMGWLFGKTSQ